MDIEAYERQERIERVEAAEANENDLVTVAVPPEESVGEALERVEEDRAEAEYIDTDEVVYGRDSVAQALEYDAVETALVSADLPAEEVREIQDRADSEGGDCVVVPTDFERGQQFREAFDGEAAILRFAID